MDYTDIPSLIPKGIRGIIFDYGGTLDSHGDHWSHIILDAYRREGLTDISTEDFKRIYIYGERKLARPDAVSPSDTFLDIMRKKIAAEASQFTPRPDRQTCEAIALRCYGQARDCTAEARIMLDLLAESYPLAVVSNFYGNLDTVLHDFGLRDCFKAVIESAQVGVRKPDPAIFRLGVEALGLTPPEVLVIGDSRDKDIVPATTIGCQTLMIEGRQWPPEE